MSIGTGIAVAGIWIAVGVVGSTGSPYIVLVAFFAMFATLFVAE